MLTAKPFILNKTNRVEYYFTPSHDLDLDVRCFGLENCDKDFWRKGIRECFLIHYIVKGRGYYIANNIRYELEPGDVFASFPNEEIIYATYPEDPFSFCWFGFNGKRCDAVLTECGLTKSAHVMRISDEYRLDKIVAECVDSMPLDEEPVKSQLQGYLYHFFSLIQKSRYASINNNHNNLNNHNRSFDYIETAVHCIEDNYMHDITVKSLASFVGLERTYFSKIFSQSTGMSPQEYIMRYRIDRAAQLIKTSGLTNRQIGNIVGIQNEYYFSRLFKKIKGVSPSKTK